MIDLRKLERTDTPQEKAQRAGVELKVIRKENGTIQRVLVDPNRNIVKNVTITEWHDYCKEFYK